MEDIFKLEVANKFIDRIDRITAQTPAQWGKMNPAQMFAHCQAPLQIANGTLLPKSNAIVSFLIGKRILRNIVKGIDFKKNLPTFNEAKITNQRDFEVEKEKLIALIRGLQSGGHSGLTKNKHPLFGAMAPEEWNALMVKHLDHHLRQFGV